MGAGGAKSGLQHTLFISSSGAVVRKNYTGTSPEEAQNLAAAKIIADKMGVNVDLLYNNPNKKTADAMINGEEWEIKTNKTPTKSAIDSAIKNAKGQSRQVILHIQSDIDINDAIKTAEHRIKRSRHVDRVMVIAKDDSIVFVGR